MISQTEEKDRVNELYLTIKKYAKDNDLDPMETADILRYIANVLEDSFNEFAKLHSKENNDFVDNV